MGLRGGEWAQGTAQGSHSRGLRAAQTQSTSPSLLPSPSLTAPPGGVTLASPFQADPGDQLETEVTIRGLRSACPKPATPAEMGSARFPPGNRRSEAWPQVGPSPAMMWRHSPVGRPLGGWVLRVYHCHHPQGPHCCPRAEVGRGTGGAVLSWSASTHQGLQRRLWLSVPKDVAGVARLLRWWGKVGMSSGSQGRGFSLK